MNKRIRFYNLLIVVTLLISACNLPSGTSAGDATGTAAAETVQAFLVSSTPLSILTYTPTFTPLPGPSATNTLIPTPISTNTPAATATSNCNVAQFITDVTIPDGTVMTPGQTFNKKWRLKNVGSCAWTGFSMVFDSGDAMGGPASKAIATVNPNQEVDLDVDLTAPAAVGSYKGFWRINTNGGVAVPVVNGNQGKSFYVDIKVQNAAVATATKTSTPVPAVFAVTGVTYNVSGTCGNFHVSANITTNGPGLVKFFWQANGSDDFEGTYDSTLNFASAQTLTTPTIDWAISAVGSHYLRVYIDDPNNQFINQTSNMNCP